MGRVVAGILLIVTPAAALGQFPEVHRPVDTQRMVDESTARWRAERRADIAERLLSLAVATALVAVAVVAFRRARPSRAVWPRIAGCASLIGALWLLGRAVYADGVWFTEYVPSPPVWLAAALLGGFACVLVGAWLVAVRRLARQASSGSEGGLARLQEALTPEQRRLLAVRSGSPPDAEPGAAADGGGM